MMMDGFRQSTHHIAAREADILEHALIELGEVPDLSAIFESLGERDERTRELTQDRGSRKVQYGCCRPSHIGSPFAREGLQEVLGTFQAVPGAFQDHSKGYYGTPCEEIFL
jgi:hypothetical protein